jgi:hypothetical protein
MTMRWRVSTGVIEEKRRSGAGGIGSLKVRKAL